MGASPARWLGWGMLVFLAVEALLALVLPADPRFGTFMDWLTLASWAGCALVWLVASISRALPRRVFYPLALWPFAAIVLTFPLFAWMRSFEQVAVTLVALQGAAVLAGALAWRGRPSPGAGGLRRAAGSVALTLFGLPVAAAVWIGGVTAVTLQPATAGAMDVLPWEVRAESRRYIRDDREVHLRAMAHVAEPAFFDAAATPPCAQALWLIEGVGGRRAWRRAWEDGDGELSSSRDADAPGLVGQSHFDARLREQGAHVLQADVEPDDISDATWELIYPGEDGPVDDGLVRLEAMWHEVVTFRNEAVLDRLDQVLATRKCVVIPWGAMHVPGIEEGLRARGFQHEGTEYLQVIGL